MFTVEAPSTPLYYEVAVDFHVAGRSFKRGELVREESVGPLRGRLVAAGLLKAIRPSIQDLGQS